MAGPGRPPNKGETKSFTVTVSQRLYDYLGYLARHTVLGTSESDVAGYLLTQQVTQMLRERFHDIEIPDEK